MPISIGELRKLKPVTKEDDVRMIKEEKKENEREYYENNKEEILARVKEYNKKHKEEKVVYMKEYHEENKEELTAYMKKYNEEYWEKNKDKLKAPRKEYRKGYNQLHKKRSLFLGSFGEESFLINLIQEVNRSGKIIGVGSFSKIRTPEQNRSNALKRSLKGVTALNEWFEGSEMHHMSKDVVMFIPKELHRSIRHNLETGENMDLINGKALVWTGKGDN